MIKVPKANRFVWHAVFAEGFIRVVDTLEKYTLVYGRYVWTSALIQ